LASRHADFLLRFGDVTPILIKRNTGEPMGHVRQSTAVEAKYLAKFTWRSGFILGCVAKKDELFLGAEIVPTK
jgi:hypothetical protein